MAAASVAFNGIVPELLTPGNYETWSVLMKNFLKGQGLWNDVVSGSDEIRTDEEWKMKNARALHAIQLSCGPHAFRMVQLSANANSAWSLLSSSYGEDMKADYYIKRGIPDDYIGEEDGYESNNMFDELFRVNDTIRQLYDHLKSSNWEAARSCIDGNPEIPLLQSPSGRTILHTAVLAGLEEIVEKLIDIVTEKEQLLQKQDIYGYTALAIAAVYTDNTRMAECMVSKCENLLTIKTNQDEIPLLLACDNCKKEMTRYLYRKTPEEEFTEDTYRCGILLLTRCIEAEIFDVALTLLQRYPELPLTHKHKHLRPLYVLAQMPQVFPSGSQ